MTQTFKLGKGEILFDEDKIIIKDDAAKQKWIPFFLIFLPAVYAFETFLSSFKTGNQFDCWYGLLFCLFCIPILALLLLRSVKSEISMKEIKSMKIKQRFGSKFLDIRLINNRLRRIRNLQNLDELEKYIKTIR